MLFDVQIDTEGNAFFLDADNAVEPDIVGAHFQQLCNGVNIFFGSVVYFGDAGAQCIPIQAVLSDSIFDVG